MGRRLLLAAALLGAPLLAAPARDVGAQVAPDEAWRTLETAHFRVHFTPELEALARRADAHALVSVHYNALPDGVNPFTAHGTGTYYFHPHSAPLARAVQAGMVRHMGLRDLGTFYGNLALVRGTWMPSVLTEGLFMMLPDQEAALRSEEGQRRYAQAVVEGLRKYLEGWAHRE